MATAIGIPNITIKDFEGDELRLSIGESTIWMDMDKRSLAFIDNSELKRLAEFILENI